MKLSYEDKVQLYKLRQKDLLYSLLSKQFAVSEAGIKYVIRLINRYGIEIVKKGKNSYYSKELKQKIINKVLNDGNSQLQTSLDYALANWGILSNWIAQYKENGYTILEKSKVRPVQMGCKSKKKLEEMTELERLQYENEYLRAENAALKKLREYRLKGEARLKEQQ
ncbi:transposase [Streptococcus uberis]|nr:transposase [Streptococcus uberis]